MVGWWCARNVRERRASIVSAAFLYHLRAMHGDIVTRKPAPADTSPSTVTCWSAGDRWDSGSEGSCPRNRTQRRVRREPQHQSAGLTDEPARDRDESTTQRRDSEARLELEAAIAVEHEEIARQHLDGEVGGVRSEAGRGDVIDREVVLRLADRPLHVGSLVVEPGDVLGLPVPIGDEEAVRPAEAIEEMSLRVVHLALPQDDYPARLIPLLSLHRELRDLDLAFAIEADATPGLRPDSEQGRGHAVGGGNFDEVAHPATLEQAHHVVDLEARIESREDRAVGFPFLDDVESLVQEGHDVRGGPCASRPEHVMHDQIADAIPGDQRMVGGPTGFVGIRSDLGALLPAVERLDCRVDVECHERLLPKRLHDDVAKDIDQSHQQLGILETPQVAVERVEVGKTIHAVAGTQERLGLEILEVVEAFDPREVRVEQNADDAIEPPQRPVRLRMAEAGRQPFLDLLFEKEAAELIDTAQGGCTGKIESLPEDSACLGPLLAVVSAHPLGTPFREGGIALQQSFYHGRSLSEPRQHSFFRDRHVRALIDTPEHPS